MTDLIGALQAFVDLDSTDGLHERSCATADVPYAYPCDCKVPELVARARQAITEAQANPPRT